MKRFFILIVFSSLWISTYAQSIQLKGTVTDKNGISLPGVSVLVEGTKIGTTTNANGQYAINATDANSALVFSSIGFIQQKINIKGRSEINVSLAEDSKSLEEVVVVGYGQQKKPSIVGAISNINMKELRTAAPSNLSNAIGGRVPGVVTRMGDGSPGGARTRYSNGDVDDAQIYIRGRASLNDQTALVLIDGVQGSLSRINPEDIEQFTVLKDASATAVYGVRGANGVILITTRKGTIGKPKISGTTQFRLLKPMAFPDFLRSYDYATLHNEAERNAGITETYKPDQIEGYRTGSNPYKYPDVNWKDELLRPNGGQFIEQQHIANINGGTERVRYYISGEYNQSGSPFVGSKANHTEYNNRRYNLRTNMDFTATKTTELAVKINGRLNDLNWPAKGESSGQRIEGVAWSDITARSPNDMTVLNPDGTYASGPSNLPNNPYADMMSGGYGRRISNTIEANFNLNQKLDFITPGLTFRTLYGVTYSSGATKYLLRVPDQYTYNSDANTYTLQQSGSINGWNISDYFNPFIRVQQAEAALGYNRTFGKSHNVTGLLAGTHTMTESQTNLPVFFKGLSGRITYSFKNKYLLEGNAGYTGSDQFNKDNRYGFFPAAAIGWVLSEEKFFKDNIKFIDFLKFRASYGEVGNDKIGSKRYLYEYVFGNPNPAPGTSNTVNGYYSFGQTALQPTPLVEGSLGNDQVTWETARKSDIGMEARFFKNRVNLEADVFLEKRDDILINRGDIADYTGLLAGNLPALNLGRMTNKGYEFALSYSDNIGGFGFTIGGNYTFVRNKVDYKGEQTRKYPWQYETGHPYQTPAAQYIWTGEFYSAEDLTNPAIAKPTSKTYAGELKFKDLNEDGIINTDDQAVTGYSLIPEEMFGVNLNMDYKNFYLSTFWQGASNVTIIPGNLMRYEFATNSYNVQPFHMDDRWVYDPARGLDTRATAKYPLLMIGGAPLTRQASTFHHLNGEYLRLKTAEFGYNFPKSITQKLRLSNLRVFVSGSNLMTFSHLKKYKLDPEYLGNNIPGQDATNGLSTGAYSPQNKFYAFGLNVTF